MSAQDLNDCLERLLSATGDGTEAALANFVFALKKDFENAQTETLTNALRRAILPNLDYTQLQSLSRLHKRLRARRSAGSPGIRLAILGGFTTKQLAQLIDLYLFGAGMDVQLYEAEYGTFRQEVLDEQSGLSAFRPNTVYLAVSRRDLSHYPDLADSSSVVRDRVRAEVSDWSTLWHALHGRLNCQILQDNFAPPPAGFLSNHELRHPSSMGRFIRLVNDALWEYAPPFVTIHDVETLSSLAGRWSWVDDSFFHHAKIPCSPDHLCAYAHSVATVVAAQSGLAKKCLILDLDNTLWGGVVGDEGLTGIRLGPGNAEGEAYAEFQRYVKGLQSRGVILAICSKNEERIAKEVFEKHPSMILRLPDISCFVANWADKPSNLRLIATQLAIGLNSMVFVDDNPAERALVRREIPEVVVPELPPDFACYVETIEKSRLFQVVSISAEDLERTAYYRTNAERQVARASATNVAEFLHSLGMVARVEPVRAENLERTVQLINKSNQFNLTTRRYRAADLLALVQDPEWITYTVSLVDRFGDNGLISVLLAKRVEEVLEIDTWVMSCRVLQRGVESLLLCRLFEDAKRQRLQRIRGHYIPTTKNGLVRGHYGALGFQPVREEEDGTSCWELDLAGDWLPPRHFIGEDPSNG